MRLVAFRVVLTLLSGFAGALLVVACEKPALPTLAPESARITSITPTRIDCHVVVRATNPNAIDLVTDDLTAHVVVAGRFDVGTVSIPVRTVLPAHKTTRLDVPLSVNVIDLAPLAQFAMGTTKIPYTVDGTVGLGGDLLHVEIPYELSDTVPRDLVVRAGLSLIPGLR